MAFVSSRLDSVTVYAQGAICTRTAKVEPAQVSGARLRLAGLPLSLLAGSLRAKVIAGPEKLRALDVRADFEVAFAAEVDVPVEQQALEKAQQQLSHLQGELARVEQQLGELAGLRPHFPAQKKGAPPREAPVEAMLQLAGFVEQQTQARQKQRRELSEQVTDAHQEVELRRRRLAEASQALRTERVQVSRAATVTLSEAPQGPFELALEYQVPGARWAPTYDLRLEKDLEKGALTLRAAVVQQTGEDWAGVKLGLSTAQLDRRTDLPQLKALKIGRSQPEPPRSGWRAPPPGLDDLFQGYDEALERRPAPPPPPQAQRPPVGFATATGAVGGPLKAKKAAKPRPAAEEKSMAMDRISTPVELASATLARNMAAPAPAMAAPPPPAPSRRPAAPGAAFGGGAPMMQARSRGADMRSDDGFEVEAELSAALDEDEVTGSYADMAPPEPEPLGPDAAMLDYRRLVMPPADQGGLRGRLRGASELELFSLTHVRVQVDVINLLVMRAEQTARGALSVSRPALCHDVRELAGSYDHRYDCEARVDVPSTGKWTIVPVMGAQVGLTPGYTTVPSVEPKVYRVLGISNRSPHALLRGPVDVSVGDEFLLTAELPNVAPGAEEARLGLGVEEALKVARKTQFKETTGGLLGGATVLPHEIEIELNNRLAFPATVEVRERVPVTQEDAIKIEESARPPWEKDEKVRDGVQVDGARKWKVTVPPGQKTTLTAQFSLRIPGDKMLVGGNRRV